MLIPLSIAICKYSKYERRIKKNKAQFQYIQSMAQKNARYNNKISMETTNTGDPDKRESETSADLTDAAYKLGLPPQYRDHRTDFAVLSSGLFILFSVLCKVIYLFMIFLIVMNKTLAYANLVFMP